MSASFDRELLDAFLAGRLDEQQVEQVLQLLEQNEQALDYVDKRWADEMPATELAPDEMMSATKQRRLERRFFNMLQRSELGGRAIRFGTAGFLNVVWAFLRPILSTRQRRRWQGEDDG